LIEYSRSYPESTNSLEGLPPNAFDERARLKSRRQALHAEAAARREDLGDERPTSLIAAELESLKARLGEVEASKTDIVKQHGSSAPEASGASFSQDINRQIEAGQGVGRMRAEIRHLEQELEKRGKAPS